MTKPFEQHLLFKPINSTVSDMSRKEEVDCHAIDNLIDCRIESEINHSHIKALCVLGLDEISMKKGYRDLNGFLSSNKQQLITTLTRGPCDG
jgi:transposase